MATLTFYGATEGVTGSAYLIETEQSTVLLECGLIQGRHEDEEANNDPFPYNINQIDAVVLSHAHLDHTGRVPKLVADGYSGPVYMTQPTRDLLEILHMDAASLQMKDAEWESKRRRRAGKPEVDALYTTDDVVAALKQYEGLPYRQRQKIADGIDICYRDAGHILGSSIVEIFISEQGVEKKLVFSGDLGNSDAALLKDPEMIEEADVVLMESTYGDRDHKPMDETLEEFERIIVEASSNGGNILIPSFAVGRTQEIIFHLGQLYHKGLLDQQAVYLDSPMAISATEVYERYQYTFNKEDSEEINHGGTESLSKYLPILKYSRSTEESMAVNKIAAGAIVIAGSGMCNGGRIRHHLKHNLWRRDAHVVIVGYQAIGTPGRALVDGAKVFKMAGEEIAVKASIHTLGGFSAHASQTQLIRWVNQFKKPHPRLYLVHGEPDAKKALREKLKGEGWEPEIPHMGQTITI